MTAPDQITIAQVYDALAALGFSGNLADITHIDIDPHEVTVVAQAKDMNGNSYLVAPGFLGAKIARIPIEH